MKHSSILRRIAAFTLVLLLMGGLVLSIGGTVAEAAGKVSIKKETLWVGCIGEITFKNFPKNGKITKITSSKPKVIGVGHIEEWDGRVDWWLDPLKAGKSKITVTYKVGSKTYKVSNTYTVKKNPRAFKTVSLNGKTVDTSQNQYGTSVLFWGDPAYRNTNKTTAKMKLTMNSGWRLKKAYVMYDNAVTHKSKTISTSVFLKGKAVKVTAKDYNLTYVAEAVNNAGETVTYKFYFVRYIYG